MDNFKYSTWDYFPHNLSPKEVNNPMITICRFFSDDGLSGAKSELKIWRDSVIENKPWTSEKGSHSGVLFYYTCNLELLDAAWLLKFISRNRDDSGKCTDERLENLKLEMEGWDETILHLSDEEMIDSFVVIHDFFSRWELPEYREILYRWVEKLYQFVQ